MSGGDYDGDKAFIIGFQPLVSQASRILGEVEGIDVFQVLRLLSPVPITIPLGSNHHYHRFFLMCVINHSKPRTCYGDNDYQG